MDDLSCPRCADRLVGDERTGPLFRRCVACRCIWIEKAQVEALSSEAHRLWRALEREGRPTGLSCPACRDRSLLVTRHVEIEIDGCASCHGILLDPGEFEALPPAPRRAAANTGHGVAEAMTDGAGQLVIEALGWLIESIGD